MKRLSTVVPAVLGAFTLAAAMPASAATLGDITVGSPTTATTIGDITHVATIPYVGRGSDIEFASREVIKLSDGATGDPVCELDEFGGCLVDADGNTVYQTEVRDFTVVGVINEYSHVVDVTDPRNPVEVAAVQCQAYQADIQIQGDLLFVAQDDNGTGRCKRPDGGNRNFVGTAILDFSDPRNPTYLSRMQYGRGSHNHTVHPTEPLVYLSDSDIGNLGGGNIPIWDFSDPVNPTLVTEFKYGADSPHDITFNADGTRAYAAAKSITFILNTEDPRDPSVVATIPNEGVSLSHQADPTPDGNYLLVADELGGGSAPVSPGGPVHVYDISNEALPVKVGLVWPDCLPQTCHSINTNTSSTSHVFRINPDGRTMAIAWYSDGVGVIDFSDVPGSNLGGTGAITGVGPRTVAWTTENITNTWAAKMWQERHPGFLFATDIGGLEIFHVPSMGE